MLTIAACYAGLTVLGIGLSVVAKMLERGDEDEQEEGRRGEGA